MTDLANVKSLAQGNSQLPSSWYADPRIHALEQKHLFANAPTYIGHTSMVPNVGDYRVLDWMGKAKALVRNEQGIDLVSNVCRHRQSLLLNGSGNAKNIVCPVHRWTYGMDGRLLGAPHMQEKPCLDLERTPLQNWRGLMFTKQRDIARDFEALGVADHFDYSNYVLNNVAVVEYNYNWKAFIEVYLDDYHVEVIHPGLSHYVDTHSLRWEFGERFSVQKVDVLKQLERPGTPVYKEWHHQLHKYSKGKMPPFGAMWLLYYPNITLEWYPYTLVVSIVLPRGPNRCTNIVEFYYPEEISLFEPEFVAAEQAAFDETAVEDEAICQRMHDGRKALFDIGENDAIGPYQTPTEDGIKVFHEWMRRELDPHV